jgi:hypothetical protein
MMRNGCSRAWTDPKIAKKERAATELSQLFARSGRKQLSCERSEHEQPAAGSQPGSLRTKNRVFGI